MKTHLSIISMLVGTAFFALSLTPSLLPRTFALQGILSGLSFAAGYGVGAACLALWRHLQLPEPAGPTVRLVRNLALAIVMSMFLASLWQAASRQNTIRALMGMEESPGIQPILILLVAVLIFFAVLIPVRIFRWLFIILSARLERHPPPRISRFLAVAASALLFWMVIDGIMVSFLLKTADRSFQQLDALIDDDLARPFHADQTGSTASLINWEDLGRQGRNFVASGPSSDELSSFFGCSVPTPIRVYVGLNSAENVEQRANLALAELLRVGSDESTCRKHGWMGEISNPFPSIPK